LLGQLGQLQLRLAHDNTSVSPLAIIGVYTCFVIYVSTY